ncbi:MAG: MoaD/ThiS family protein [Chloroflexi bacterium]|nr:MoaD/ThiS family protein [Chloroflexota bacterium]
MKINFFATYRQAVGRKTVDFELPEGATIRTLIDEIVTRYPKLRGEMLDEAGQLYRHVHIFVNGRDAPYLPDGLDTRLTAADVVNVFPPVAGG